MEMTTVFTSCRWILDVISRMTAVFPDCRWILDVISRMTAVFPDCRWILDVISRMTAIFPDPRWILDVISRMTAIFPDRRRILDVISRMTAIFPDPRWILDVISWRTAIFPDRRWILDVISWMTVFCVLQIQIYYLNIHTSAQLLKSIVFSFYTLYLCQNRKITKITFIMIKATVQKSIFIMFKRRADPYKEGTSMIREATNKPILVPAITTTA